MEYNSEVKSDDHQAEENIWVKGQSASTFTAGLTTSSQTTPTSNQKEVFASGYFHLDFAPVPRRRTSENGIDAGIPFSLMKTCTTSVKPQHHLVMSRVLAHDYSERVASHFITMARSDSDGSSSSSDLAGATPSWIWGAMSCSKFNKRNAINQWYVEPHSLGPAIDK